MPAGALRGAPPAQEAAWAIGDAPTVRGFELAGFHGVVAETAERVRAALADARARGVRLVVMTEREAAEARDALEDAVRGVRPLVAVVPSLAGGSGAASRGEHIRRAVRRALGVPGAGTP